MILRLCDSSLYPVTDSLIRWIKIFQVFDLSSRRRLTLLCSKWITMAAFFLTPPTSPEPYYHPGPYTTSALLPGQNQCAYLCGFPINNDPCFPCEKQMGHLFSPFLIFSSWFLAMQYPNERKSHSLQNPYLGVLMYSQALHRYIWWFYCTEQEIWYVKDFSVPTSGMTRLCTSHTWASWEISIFVFQYCCKFTGIAV